MTDTTRVTPPDVEVLETEPVPPAVGSAQAQAYAAQQWHAKRKLAWTLAIIADGIQIALVPLAAMELPISEVIDVLMAITMVKLLGWHPAFLPTLIAEAIPFVNLVPTWTAAVWLATRGDKAPPEMPRT
jgi:hypothetical protein